MDRQQLDPVFKPRSIAVIGASERPGSVGRAVSSNLLGCGFERPLHFVNPKHASLFGRPCYAGVADLPEPPDLAVIATPAETVADLVAGLSALGTPAAVVLTAGVGGRTEPDGRRILETANKYGMRIIGPNCLGVLTPSIGLNASFAHLSPRPGRLAFISQSGAILTSVLDSAAARQIGFSGMASLGNELDVEVGDLVDYFAADRHTSAILLYVEAIRDARLFMSAARRASRVKPVIVMKVGRFPEGAKAALSHTGALAGSDAVYDAAFRRAGIVRVLSLEELFDAAEILGLQRPFFGEDMTIVTNGGGAGVIAADCLHANDGRLAALSPQTKAALDSALPPTWSRANPIDIIGDADGARYAAALAPVLDAPESHAVLVIRCPTSISSAEETAQAVIDTVLDYRKASGSPKPVLTCWLGQETVGSARTMFKEAGIATFESPEDAVQALMHMIALARARKTMMRMPRVTEQDFTVDRDAASAMLSKARFSGTMVLSEADSKQLLARYGIRIAESIVAATPAEAGEIAGTMLALKDAPEACVLKIVSPDITHKSDVGGVRLGIRSPEEAVRAAEDILRGVAEKRPEARLTGIAVQPMIERAGTRELIAGLTQDPTFGPVVLFGAGGSAVEVLDDKAIELPPLDELLARSMIARTRVSKLLAGYRHFPAANLDAIVETLIRLSRLAEEQPDIAELDINPLLADADGVIALDARIALTPETADTEHADDRLAIAPYPDGWAEDFLDSRGLAVHLRPILPTDERLYPDFFEKVSDRDIRFRLFAPRRQFTHDDFARWTQIDYSREMAFVALGREAGTLLGVARLASDLTLGSAEFAVLIRSDMQGRGIGVALMRKLIDYGRTRRLTRVHGIVLRENRNMRTFCRALGFVEKPAEEGRDVIAAELDLTKPEPLPDNPPHASGG